MPGGMVVNGWVGIVSSDAIKVGALAGELTVSADRALAVGVVGRREVLLTVCCVAAAKALASDEEPK